MAAAASLSGGLSLSPKRSSSFAALHKLGLGIATPESAAAAAEPPAVAPAGGADGGFGAGGMGMRKVTSFASLALSDAAIGGGGGAAAGDDDDGSGGGVGLLLDVEEANIVSASSLGLAGSALLRR